MLYLSLIIEKITHITGKIVNSLIIPAYIEIVHFILPNEAGSETKYLLLIITFADTYMICQKK